MPRSVPRPRLVLALAIAAALVLCTLLWTRGGAHAGSALAAGTVTRDDAVDVAHPGSFGLQVLHDHLDLHPTSRQLPPAPQTSMAGGIVIDIDTGEILWQQNQHQALPPASTTKILTALVALQNYAPDHRITITAGALDQAWDETKMGLKAGETLTVQELLTGMMLVSANDAATALADDTAGMGPYVAAMNAQLRALGLSDSHVSGTVGLDAPDHHISAYDLAVVATVTWKHFALFRDIVANPHATLPATADHQSYDLWNIDQLLQMYPGAVGIKPGWTGDAGPCEVGLAVRDGHRLLAVVLNAPKNFSQARALLDWGFTAEGLPALLPPTPTPSPSAPAH